MKNIYELFLDNALLYHDKVAIACDNKSYLYEDLKNSIESMSCALKIDGVKKGSRVMVMLENSYEFAVLFFAIAKIGAIIAPIDTTSKFDTIKLLLQNIESKYLITNSIIKKNFNEIDARVVDINTLFECRDKLDSETDEAIDPRDDYILTMTSGSTGDPKAILLSQDVKINRAIAGAKKLYDLDRNDVVLCASPMYHSLGMRLVILPLIIGATCVILKKFHPRLWIDTVKQHNATFTIAVSTHLKQLVKYLQDGEVISLKRIVSSSALLSTDTKQECIEKFQCKIDECYGASEIGIATNLAFEDTQKLKSVGKALDYVDLKVVDENGKVLQHGEIGEIIVKTTTPFINYYKNDIKTTQSVKDGYFYTEDLGYLDEDGYLFFCGRKKDVIIVSGMNIYPKDIEEVILGVRGVKECCVVGVDDEYFTEGILAVLVINDEFNLKDVKIACFKALSNHQQPMAYEIVDALPKNKMGKVQKFKLKEMFKDYDLSKDIRRILR